MEKPAHEPAGDCGQGAGKWRRISDVIAALVAWRDAVAGEGR